MRIVFGTGFYGKVGKLNNQWIETKFVHLFFVPIFPTGSMLVTNSEFRKRRGLQLPTNKKSVISVYASMFTFLMGVFFWFSLTDTYYETVEAARWGHIWGWAKLILCAAAWVYFFFFYGKATKEEIAVRTKVGQSMGYYAKPEWFDYAESKSILTTLSINYMSRYPGQDWKTDLKNGTSDLQQQRLLFALALFNCMVYDVPENDELYFKADQLFNPGDAKANALIGETNQEAQLVR